MKNGLLTLAATATVLFGLTASASAQARPAGAQPGTSTSSSTTANPSFELSGAYQLLKVTGDSSNTFPFGLAVDGAKYWGQLGLVAEGGWSHDSADTPAVGGVPAVSVKSDVFHVGAGPRFMVKTNSNVRPYVQVLGGFSTIRGKAEIGGVSSSDHESAFMIQPGGGATIVLGDGWGLFGDIAYRRSFFDTATNGVRVLIGARMILD